MKVIGNILKYLFLVAALGALAFSGYTYLKQRPDIAAALPFAPQPCTTPLEFTVARFDTGFGITKTDFVSALKEAAGLWNTAAGKTVLSYSDGASGALPINLIFDQREQAVLLGKTLQADQSAYGTARTEINTLEANFTSAKQALAAKQAAYNDSVNNYEAEVARVNAAGGASQTEYARLQSEKSQLELEQSSLQADASNLNVLAAQINSKVDAFNATVQSANKQVDAYNEVAGSDFDQGEYVQKGTGQKYIDIYAFRNHAELVHALAHELGHALGLGHNTDPSSIMYPYNESSTELSAEDIAALRAACKL